MNILSILLGISSLGDLDVTDDLVAVITVRAQGATLAPSKRAEQPSPRSIHPTAACKAWPRPADVQWNGSQFLLFMALVGMIVGDHKELQECR